MAETLQEQASRIIAQALDLTEEEGRGFIKAQCQGNEELFELTLRLYEGIIQDNQVTDSKIRQLDREGFSKSRIGQANINSQVVNKITNLLFGNKTNRLITLISFLTIIFISGFFIRKGFRESVIAVERSEQMALLNINYKALQQWIDLETRQTADMANDPELIRIAVFLDSLVEADPSYDLLHRKELIAPVYSRLSEFRKEHEVEAMSLINKRDPVYMILSEVSQEGSDKAFNNLKLGRRAYDYYLRLKETDSSLFIRPMHDSEKFQEIPKDLNVGTYCTFCEPVYKNGQVVAYLFCEFNAKNEFSEILQISHHNKTAETYAANRRGRMLSESRFTRELQKTYLLDFDTTRESIYNIRLVYPGNNVFKNKEPKIPEIDQKYTRVVAQALSYLETGDTIYEGSVEKPYYNYMGIKVMGAWKALPGYDFGLIDEIDAREALMSLRYFDGAFFLFLLFTVFLSVLLYNSNVRIARFGKRIEDFSKLGQYKLLEKLGEGGFGEVFKAEHSFLKTPVAIKLLKKEFIGTDMLDRFEKEVIVTSSLAHPNTVKVYDYGTSQSGQFYYVMEYLNGLSLSQVVRPDEAFPVSRGVHVLLHVCLSLQEAHAKGLIHRDIKPMNVMLCNQGGAYDVVKVLDFGLVKKVDATTSQQTQINRIGGTPMFMAPERLRDPMHADQRIDIYAVGALGLYLFSGQYLLELISQKMLSGQKTLHGNFRDRLIERNDIPEKLKELLVSCIHFEPSKRPQNIEELIEVLEEITSENPWTRNKAMEWWKNYDVYG